MTDWNKLYADMEVPSRTDNRTHACNCVGPQGGKPLCPCRMRGVKVIGGRYVETIDHGPVGSST